MICNHGFGIRSVDRSSHWAGCFRSHRIKTALAGELVPLVSSSLPTPLNIPYTHDMSVRASDLVIILVTLVFPPAGAYFVAGCGRDLVINILLTM